MCRTKSDGDVDHNACWQNDEPQTIGRSQFRFRQATKLARQQNCSTNLTECLRRQLCFLFRLQLPLKDVSTGEELHTLKGHTSGIRSVSFSPDGTRPLSRGAGEKLIWDLKSGKVLPDGNVEEFPAGNDSTSTTYGRWLAISSGYDALLVDLAYQKTPRELQRRKLLARPKPRWHSKQFQAAQSAERWYPAIFHAAWLLKLKPADAVLHDDLQELITSCWLARTAKVFHCHPWSQRC